MTDNIYEIATSPNMNKKLHHRFVPMMMFTAEGKEVVLPMVLGTARDMSIAESNAEKDVAKDIGEVSLSNRNTGSVWLKLMNTYRAAWIVYLCTRMPDDLTKKFFDSKDQVMDTYDSDELGILLDHYGTVRYTSPHFKLIDPNDPNSFQEAIDKIKQQGTESDFFLNGFTTHSLNQLIKYLVSLVTNLESTIGGSGMPSNNTTTNEKIQKPKNNEKKQ